MADIKLIKPQAGEKTTIQSAADARLEFAFSTADAIVEKSGNDLVFTFTDGSSVVLTDFYTAYTKETLPEFVVEGQTIAGSEFFAALGNDDLMPAAGPAAAQAPAGGRFHEYDEAGLMDGLDRLNGLDNIQSAGTAADTAFVAPAAAFVPTVGAGALADGSGVAGGGTIPPVDPTPPVNHAPVIGIINNLIVKEDSGDAIQGSTVMANDSDGDTLNYWLLGPNGEHLTSLEDKLGTLTIDPVNGKYQYTLNNDEKTVQALNEGQSIDLPFTIGVSDAGGASDTKDINVTINGTNDQPTLELSQTQLTVTDKGTVTDSGDARGTDVDDGAQLTYSFTDGQDNDLGSTITDGYGTLTLDPVTGTYTVDADSPFVQGLGKGESHKDTFWVRVTDEHGATSDKPLSFTINGTNDLPVVEQGSNSIIIAEDNGTEYAANDAPVVDADKSASGTVTLNDDGTYTSTLNEGYQPEAGQQDSFTVTINDGNGSEITQEITIDINPKAEEPEIPAQHEQAAAISLFVFEGDESLYDGLGTDADIDVHPMGFSGSAAYGTGDGAELEASGTLLAFLAADLFPQDTGEDMDALLMNSLSEINATPLAADMAAQEAASAEVSFTPEVVDMPASAPHADGMAEATDMAAHKIMLENNG